jgi:hypothetical protein
VGLTTIIRVIYKVSVQYVRIVQSMRPSFVYHRLRAWLHLKIIYFQSVNGLEAYIEMNLCTRIMIHKVWMHLNIFNYILRVVHSPTHATSLGSYCVRRSHILLGVFTSPAPSLPAPGASGK